MFRQPVMVYAADAAGIRRAYERAMARELDPAGQMNPGKLFI